MRMSGQLQGDAELRGVPRIGRLVIEQDDGDAVGDACQNGGMIPDRVRPPMARRPVGEAGDRQPATIAIENDAVVFERPQSQFGEARHPWAVTENVLVIARDHVDAVGRLQVPQRLDVGATRIERAVDQIPRDRDQVDAEPVRPLDDGARPRRGKQPADMEVGQLQDRVSVELSRKPADADLDVLQRRNPHRLMNADGGRYGRHARQRVADAIRRAHEAAMDQHADQKPDIEQHKQQCQQDDRTKRPVKESDHRTRKLRREDRARRELATPVKLQRDQDEHRRHDLDRERQLQRPEKAGEDQQIGEAEDELGDGFAPDMIGA